MIEIKIRDNKQKEDMVKLEEFNRSRLMEREDRFVFKSYVIFDDLAPGETHRGPFEYHLEKIAQLLMEHPGVKQDKDFKWHRDNANKTCDKTSQCTVCEHGWMLGDRTAEIYNFFSLCKSYYDVLSAHPKFHDKVMTKFNEIYQRIEAEQNNQGVLKFFEESRDPLTV